MTLEAKDLQPKFTALADALGGAYEWTRVPRTDYKYVTHFEIEVDGVRIIVVPVNSKNGLTAARFAIELPFPITLAQIRLRRETWLDRVGSRLRINREFQTRDPSFDRKVYIEGDATDATLARIFREAETRAPVLGLLQVADLVEIMTVAGSLDALLEPARIARTVAMQVPLKQLEKRDALIAACRTFAAWHGALQSAVETLDPYGRNGPGTLDVPLETRWGRGAACFFFAMGTWVAFASISKPYTLGWRAFGIGAAVGLVVWLCELVVFALLLRGRSTSLGAVVVFGMLALGTLPAGGRAAELVNARRDETPRREVEGRIESRKSKNGSFRVLVVPSGHAVPLADNQSAGWVAGHRATAVVGEGRLGSMWIVSITPK